MNHHHVERLERLRSNLAGVIRGKDECIEVVTIALIAGGCILMEDVPGVGKTTLAKAMARSIDASFHRIQFTPDLLPADILGSSIYNPVDGSFEFSGGPVFCNVLLADEINRASPRTQSALLEAMNEAQATIEGVCRPLPSPFLVIATQNSVEFHGTYPLPEAQLDRFLVRVNLGYPDAGHEVEMLHAQAKQHPLESLECVLSRDDVIGMQSEVRDVRVDESLAQYVVEIVRTTRDDARLKLGVSPRGSLMMFRAAQAAAYSDGREFVLPDDVQKVAPYVLPHRLILTSKARYSGIVKADIVADIVSQVKVPT